ncbi:hypothetical protein LINGRAHAP2_LOCUS4272 [Linum grandiflorum]
MSYEIKWRVSGNQVREWRPRS